jgi:GTP-binding protein Era
MTRPKAKPEAPAATRAGKFVLLGRPNVGKSTLLNALVGENIAIVSHHPQTTRDRILGVYTDGDSQFMFIDTPGLHQARTRLGARMNLEARDALDEADAVVFVTDVTSDMRPSVRDDDLVIVRELPKKVPAILIINKVDRIADKSKLLPLLEAYAKAHPFVAILPISARRADGPRRLVEELRGLLPENPKPFEDDALSDRPTRFFVAEFVREQILKKTRQEVPHGVAVVVERFEEEPRVPKIQLAVIVDRESHKKIVIGRHGSLLKAIGQDARARVEALMGKQVHLKIWVRVVPRWYESDAKLRELGYGPGVGTGEAGR